MADIVVGGWGKEERGGENKKQLETKRSLPPWNVKMGVTYQFSKFSTIFKNHRYGTYKLLWMFNFV